MMVKDEWVQAAITDDNVVVELLVRLKRAQAAPPVPKSALSALKWGIRHPRSKPKLERCDTKRDGDFNVSARGSPTTPLCWSGGSSDASPSAADVFEETSTHVLRSPPVAPSRSKGSGSSESNRTSTKRSRKKKEIASTHAVCKEHRASNENFKRMRLDLNLNTAKKSSLIAVEPEKVHCLRALSSFDSTLPSEALDDDCKPQLDSRNVGKAISSEESLFLLPDLNMMPDEDDSCPKTLIQD